MKLHLAESYIDGTPALVSVRCPDVLPGTTDGLAKFYTESHQVQKWRSALVSNLLEFGIDDETGWLYRVFRQPSGISIKQKIAQSGPFSVRAACRIGAKVSRMQLEAAHFGIQHLFIEPHQVYYWSDSRDEDVSLLGVGLSSARTVPTYHSTAQLLAHMLLGRNGETSSHLPSETVDGMAIPQDLVHLHALLRNVRLDEQPLDDGTIIGALEVLASGQSLPLDLLPPLSSHRRQSDSAPLAEYKQMDAVSLVIVPEPDPPALESNNYKSSNPKAVETSPTEADKDTGRLKPKTQEPLFTPFVFPMKWLWIVGFLLACGWIYSVI